MRRWAAAVLIAVSGALTVVPGTADAAVPVCGDVLFVGAAGSGENGMGAEVSAVLPDIRAAAPQRRLASYPFRQPRGRWAPSRYGLSTRSTVRLAR
jgi:hypothetical protein